jgi:hypothetical protein
MEAVLYAYSNVLSKVIQNVWCNLYWIATLATTPAASGEGV